MTPVTLVVTDSVRCHSPALVDPGLESRKDQPADQEVNGHDDGHRMLEARGYRVTPSRRAVIAAILAQQGHFTVDDLLARCRDAGRATVFRTIRLLTKLGVVCRVLLEDGSRHYMVSQRGHHHHMVCTACGNVQDLNQCVISDVVKELSEATGYEVEGHWLELYGRCAGCRARTGTPA